MKDGDFRSYVAVYQRVDWWGSSFQNLFPQGASTFPEKKQTNKKQKLCTVAIYGPRLLFYLHDNYMK